MRLTLRVNNYIKSEELETALLELQEEEAVKLLFLWHNYTSNNQQKPRKPK